jgi:predicted alpha/beta-hydrolase family hydrolase
LIWTIPVGTESTTAEYDPALGDQRGIFVCAHGAGGSLKDRSTLAAANALRRAGLGVVRFNFLYKEGGSGRPDPMPKLMDTAAAVAEYTRGTLKPDTLIVGGRSMGGRAYSMLAAEGFDVDGLLLLAYPLHPPGEKGKLRDAHLPSIQTPVLCFNGTRDEFCDPAIMRRVINGVKSPWTMHWLEGADHSFHVLKSSGRTDAMVLDEVCKTAEDWLTTVSH